MPRWLSALRTALIVLSLCATADVAVAQFGGPNDPDYQPPGNGRERQSIPNPWRPLDLRRAGVDPSEVVMLRRDQPEYALIGPPPDANRAARALIAVGAQIRRQRDYPNLGRRAYYLRLPTDVRLPEATQIVEDVAPPVRIDLHTVYRFAQGQGRLYAPGMIGDPAPGSCALARPVRIGVIDGPVDPAHPALAGVRLFRMSVLGEREPRPPDNHGTAVVALIAGEDASGLITGFARRAEIHAVSAFTISRGREYADFERIAAAMDVLVGRGVRLMNMSFAGPPSRALQDVLTAASDRGVVMIAAVGNEGADYPAFPAAAPEVIGVTAIDARQRLYRQANRGEQVEFAAPGVDLYTARGRGGGYVSGTSFAAPIVTALAARQGAGRGLGTNAVRQRLRSTAVDLGDPGRDGSFGWGLVRGGGC